MPARGVAILGQQVADLSEQCQLGLLFLDLGVAFLQLLIGQHDDEVDDRRNDQEVDEGGQHRVEVQELLGVTAQRDLENSVLPFPPATTPSIQWRIPLRGKAVTSPVNAAPMTTATAR